MLSPLNSKRDCWSHTFTGFLEVGTAVSDLEASGVAVAGLVVQILDDRVQRCALHDASAVPALTAHPGLLTAACPSPSHEPRQHRDPTDTEWEALYIQQLSLPSKRIMASLHSCPSPASSAIKQPQNGRHCRDCVGRDHERLPSQVGLQFVNKLLFFRKIAAKPVALENAYDNRDHFKTLHSKYEWLTCLWRWTDPAEEKKVSS